MFQGRRKDAAEKNRVVPFDPAMVTNMVLSHAHIDHSGRIPLLSQKGFAGRIFCTRATADACGYLLPDSAHIQEQDAQYLNYKTVRGALSHGHTINGKPVGKRNYEKIKKMLKEQPHPSGFRDHRRLPATLPSGRRQPPVHHGRCRA